MISIDNLFIDPPLDLYTIVLEKHMEITNSLHTHGT